MNEDHEGRLSVYEIGYLVGDSVTEENVPAEAEKVRKIITKSGATIIAEGEPARERLAYTIRRKTIAGSYEKFDSAYFGWVKFEAPSSTVEAMKNEVEKIPSVIRMILISTVRENTFLGKKAPALKEEEEEKDEKVVEVAPAATIEEMDKSIDEMVKEA